MSDKTAELAPQVEATPVDTVTTETDTSEAETPVDPGNALEVGLAGGEKPVAVTATWPEDWRAQMAGGDEKALKQLERYKTPADVDKARREAQRTISSGELSRAKPEDEAQVAAWREERGIPADPTGYDLNELGDGLVVGEDDKPIIDAFLSAMHGADATPDQVRAGVSAYYAKQQEMLSEQSGIDKKDADDTLDAMAREWGAEQRANLNQLKGFLDAAPEGVGKRLLSGRLGDGKGIMNDFPTVSWLLSLSQQINPMGTVVPAGGDPGATVAAEIESIETMMRDEPDKYYNSPAVQARYDELLEYQERQKK